MTIALIGLGNIGFHFASRLLAAGEDLLVHDLDAARVSRVAELGGRPGGRIEDLVMQSEIVLLSLPMPGIVRSVTASLAIPAGPDGRIVLDLSTTGPAVTKEVAAILSAANIGFVSAPVSGGTQAAEKGALAIMAAGEAEPYLRVEPLLRILGKNIFYLGADPSLGQTMKILNNTLSAVNMVAALEALVYGVKAGLDPQIMLDILNVSSGRSYHTLERIPQCVLDRGFPLRFATELLHKDIKMCIDDAERIGSPLIIAPTARQFLAFAITQGDGDKDCLHIIRHFEEWAGVQVGAAPVNP